MKNILEKILRGQDLREEEMIYVMENLMDGKFTDSQTGSFLTGLRVKGESLEEILGATRVLRKRAKEISIDSDNTLDTCGTGGDCKSTFNISTTVSFVVATYVPVIKHGNRSVSSNCGSADVLELLGVNLFSKEEVNRLIEQANIAFLYAPYYHETMKEVGKIRKELEIRTIFNILGPLINPGQPKAQLIGVYEESLTSKFIRVLKKLGVKRALVVHGLDGLDEISISTKSKISELKNGKIKEYYLDPRNYGLAYAPLKTIEGSGAKENAEILLNILRGEKGAKRDIVVLNSAAAIYIAGKAKSIEEGIKLAEKSIDSGHALKNLEKLIKISGEKTNDLRQNII